MKHKAMRLVAFCLVLVLLLGSFPFAFATEGTTQEPTVQTEFEEETATSTEPTESTESTEAVEPPEANTDAPPTRNSSLEGYVYKPGIVWSTDPGKAFDAVFNGVTTHVDSLSLFAVNHNGAYVPCYCIAPGLNLATGSPYEKHELTTSDAWISLTEAQRQAIGLTLIYGYPNGINPSSMFDQKGAQAATQMIVWEICYGMRKTTYPYNCTDSRYIDLFNPDSWGNQFTDGGTGTGSGMIYNLKSCYQQISDKMAQHFKAPSFMSTDTDTAQIFDMTPNGNGTYSVTLTDSNNMLSAINFKNTDTLTFTKSGSKLTITASKPISETTVKATKNVPNLEAQTFIIWTHTDKQPVAEPLTPTNDPTSLYLKLRIRTGNLGIKKTTSDGKMLGGWKFTLYSDQACTKQVYGPYTTASDGTITAKDLLVGTYWIKEVGNTDSAVQAKYKCEGENPRKITITAGKTTSVTFNNILKTGNLGIKKTTSDGKMLGGWKFILYSDQACTKQVYGPYTTASDGTITAKDLLVGTYWIKEVGNTDSAVQSKYKCEGENPRKITITTEKTTSVTFNNILKTGNLGIKKTTSDGKMLGGWKFILYSDQACTKQVYGPYTTASDGTISAKDLLAGTYWIKEVGNTDSAVQAKYKCEGENPRKITITAGKTTSVTFNNILKTGNLGIKKTTSDGKMLGGWKFILCSDQACTKQVYGPYTTASDGTITAKDLLAGTYWIKEVGNTDSAVQAKYKCEGENPRKITITAGKTTSVTFNNILKTGNLGIKKTTSDGKMLGGWKFILYSDQACTKQVYGPYTTASDGTISAKDLLAGTYWIKEVGNTDSAIQARYKCEGENPRKITLTDGKTTSVTFNNILQVGNVKLIKKTNTGGSLVGWKIGIYTDSACTKPISGSPFVTGTDGSITVPNLVIGVYYAKEVDESAKYPYWEFDSSAKKVTVEANKTASVTFSNTQYGRLRIKKNAVNGTPEGWRFDLLNASKEVVATLKTDSDGYAYSDLLLPGKYYIREIHDRSEIYWTYDAEVEKEATVTAGKDVTIEYTNEQFGRISFHKTTDTGKYLEGWVFRVTDEAGNLVGEYTTDYTGYAVTGKLKPGKYFVTEVAKDDPYWVVNVETHTVDAMAGRTVEDNWHNSEYGMGTFRKTTNTGTDLEGWQFTVYSDEKYQNVVAVVTTDEDGEVSRMFEPGRYYVKETGDTKGRFESEAWTIDKVVRVITIRAHEESTVSFRNNMYGKISVQKVDPEGNPLANAVFRLEWSKDGKRWEPVYFQKGTAPEGSCSNRDVVDGKLTTGKDGIISWGRLHINLYYRLTEVRAPDGYTLLSEPAFEGMLPEGDPIVTLRAVNAHQFEMPQTGSGAMLRLPLVLIFCTLVCAGSLFCLKKKKRE